MVELDVLDHEIEFVGAVDLPGYAVVVVWHDQSGFCEVVQPINPSGRVVFHDEHHTAFAFRPREQEEMVGAEVEHGLRSEGAAGGAPAPTGSSVVGLAGRLPGAGYHHSAELACCRGLFDRGRIGIPVTFAEAVAAQEKDFGVLHQSIGGGDGGVVEDVAPVGERRIGSDDSGAFLAVASGDDLIEEVRTLLVER
jgi:hypothetical protein